jgi:hypothetical protein
VEPAFAGPEEDNGDPNIEVFVAEMLQRLTGVWVEEDEGEAPGQLPPQRTHQEGT